MLLVVVVGHQEGSGGVVVLGGDDNGVAIRRGRLLGGGVLVRWERLAPDAEYRRRTKGEGGKGKEGANHEVEMPLP